MQNLEKKDMDQIKNFVFPKDHPKSNRVKIRKNFREIDENGNVTYHSLALFDESDKKVIKSFKPLDKEYKGLRRESLEREKKKVEPAEKVKDIKVEKMKKLIKEKSNNFSSDKLPEFLKKEND